MALSYSQGLGTTPLLGETIGENFDRAVREHPDRDALVVRHQDVALHLRASWARRSTAPPARSPASGWSRATASASGRRTAPSGCITQFATAKLGVILVNINPAYRTSELAYALRQSGCRALVSAPSFKTSDYRAMIERGPRRPARARARAVHRRGVCSSDAPDEIEWPELDLFEPINIQYTSGTTGRPKGATLSHSNILNNGFFVGEFCDYTEAGPGLHPGALLPLLRHGHGQPRRRLPRRLHGHPGAVLRARRDARGGGRGALHEPLRRADDVHRRARGPELRRARPELAADRDHGRLAVPRAGHAQGHRPHAHGGRDHLLRHDRDLAGVDPDDRRGRARAPRRHRRARAPARRGQGRRPGDRPHRPARRAGRALHPRLQRDARLLGGPGAHRARRSTPRASCTPATSRRWTTRAT